MFQEIKDSVNKYFYTRISSPFYGTFLITWAIWNWRLIYVTLFLNEQHLPTNKLDFIASRYLSTGNLLILPFLYTLFLTMIFPQFTNWIYEYSRKFENDRLKIKQKYDDKMLITVEEKLELEKRISDQEAEFDKVLKKWQNENNKSHRKFQETESELNNLKGSVNAPKVMYAIYGNIDKFVDVTALINRAVNEAKKNVLVSNSTLTESDPVPGKLKFLLVVRRLPNGMMQNKTIIEGETFYFDDLTGESL